MRHHRSRLLVCTAALLFAFAPLPGAAAPDPAADAAGCADHPMFTRMQHMRILSCRAFGFDSFKFKTGKATDTTVEGKRFEIKYQIVPGHDYPGALAVLRNHQQAVGKIGGSVLHEDQRYTWLKVAKDGQEAWAQVDTAWGKGYMLSIVEKQQMVQEVVASADLFRSGLNATGHVEVPGIYFDTGKAVLKPESDAALGEIGKLLKADPELKVFVVGHTDNVASLDSNLKLSQARAAAVVQALVTRHGIAASRLDGQGAGPLAPVASNGSDEGRAKNRRVELVKR